MKLSICNIAWPKESTERILSNVAAKGFNAIEISPSRVWDDFRQIPLKELQEYYKYVKGFGLEICSMHSLFWGMTDMEIFGAGSLRKKFIEYFEELVKLASSMEVPHMVFGSPKVRKRGKLDINTAIEVASELLFPIAEKAYNFGTKILIEPLSVSETDFITDHREGLELVRSVNSRGFGLHLDAKAICSEKYSLEDVFSDSFGQYEHFHVNEVGLGSFKIPKLPHEKVAGLMGNGGYEGYVSIEMKQMPEYEAEIDAATDFVKRVYGGLG